MKFTHKGYTLDQTEYNYHYVIQAADGHVVMHVQHDKLLTEEQAKEAIEFYICLSGM